MVTSNKVATFAAAVSALSYGFYPVATFATFFSVAIFVGVVVFGAFSVVSLRG